jgi:hypothetical protein
VVVPGQDGLAHDHRSGIGSPDDEFGEAVEHKNVYDDVGFGRPKGKGMELAEDER